jgi:hypothetical protein
VAVAEVLAQVAMVDPVVVAGEMILGLAPVVLQ